MIQPLKDVTVFYSWQSDLPDETNRHAIRTALRDAKKSLKAKFSVSIDEATRDTPGSPNIPLTIMDKIRNADVFIADVTTITNRSGTVRPCPNPNVVFELGFATAHLGWERIILLVNEDISPLKDLPFDFDRHRAMTYKLSPNSDLADKKALAQSLALGLSAIVKHDPKRPRDYEGMSLEQMQRQRDMKNAEWALSQIHIPGLDDFILEMPNQLNTRILFFYESFKGVLTNRLFHLNDDELERLFRVMLTSWSTMLAHDTHYRETNNVYLQIWDGGQRGDDAEVYQRIAKAGAKLKAAKDKLLTLIRKRYPEIDIAAANKSAWDRFRKAITGVAPI